MKNIYNIDTLTRAVDLLQNYENILVKEKFAEFASAVSAQRTDDVAEFDVITSLNVFMIKLKNYLTNTSAYMHCGDELQVFEVITEIAFDKLEKDIMGVN